MMSSQQYPRPDFQRPSLSWQSLNKQWDFAFDDNDTGIDDGWHKNGIPETAVRKINVPFVYQAPASGINEQVAHQVVWYESTISDLRLFSQQEQRGRLLLRFGAVDYEATVWLGGNLLGSHRGGQTPFEFDVSDHFDNNHSTRLVIRIWDAAADLTQPRGKQYWGPKPESIFYTPSTGIWQSVWLEVVPKVRIADSSHGTVLRSNDIDSGELHAEIAVCGRRKTQQCFVVLSASLGGVLVSQTDPVEVDMEKEIARLKLNLKLDEDKRSQLPKTFTDNHSVSDESCWLNGLALWTPEHPILYDLEITLQDQHHNSLDTITTTTGMRSLSWINNDGTFRLNKNPYFQALVLDQGYWPSTNMTPPTPDHLKTDIQLAKSMGFNGCRKHQKVEDPIFLYWANRLGFLVWGEMANAYEFSNQYIERFDQEWMEAVRRDMNDPCIVTWTPVNETWGYDALKNSEAQQNHIRSLYYMTKTIDPTRSINDNCGWEHVCTDLTTFHDYSDGPELAKTCQTMERILQPKGGREMFLSGSQHCEGAPVMCTEFGGVNIAPKVGEAVAEGSWGYTTASDAEDLLERVRRLMMAVVEGGHCCAFVYTQLQVRDPRIRITLTHLRTDIEQETNGLYTFDRKEKLPAMEVKKTIEDVQRTYFQKLAARK